MVGTQNIILMEKNRNYIPDLESIGWLLDAESTKTCKETISRSQDLLPNDPLMKTGLMRMPLSLSREK